MPTDLVHELNLRLLDWRIVRWHNRAHFFSTTAGIMRRALVDLGDIAFQGSRVTSDAGLVLVRELDERLGLEAIMGRAPARLSPRTEHAIPVDGSLTAVGV